MALLRETPRSQRLLALPGVASVLVARKPIERHFAWMAEDARRNPRWWNRAWR